MIRSITQAVCALILLALPCAAPAQGSKADYQRADNLERATANKVFKGSVIPHWFSNNTKLWYRNATGNVPGNL